MSSLKTQIHRRRTFAIISHPDAGKTTLTEKLLWYGGAIQVAGEVRARKASRHATSDWMELEKQRGISVTSSVMQFPYRQHIINLLDTPGHEDFSEDTYRPLTAVDSAVMVIDSVNGVEAQTIKLLHVCRMRDTPIVTFINKLDREGKPPIELLDEIESVLGMQCAPMTWPIGMGKAFRGVYHLYDDRVLVFDPHADKSTGEIIEGLAHPRLDECIGDQAHELRQEVELVRGASHAFDRSAYLAGTQTPVFFGSAVNNFGVQMLLDAIVDLSPPPKAREAESREVAPEEHKFSGFVFKIQANMDPRHRDRIAFVRVCSGRFDRDMTVFHSRSEKKVRLASSHKLFGNERETVDEAWPGDVIGLVGHNSFGICDTLTTDPQIIYKEIPRFTPEAFSYLHNPNTAKFKQFRQGLEQLMQEGVIQALYLRNSSVKTPLLAAVAPLQFEVVQFRLESEYGAVSRLEAAPWTVVRWLPVDMKEDDLDALSLPTGSRIAYDVGKNPVVLFANDWSADYFTKTNERVPLSALPVQTVRE